MMLEDAANGGEGKYFVIKNYRIAGKTGTAVIPKTENTIQKKLMLRLLVYLSGEKSFNSCEIT